MKKYLLIYGGIVLYIRFVARGGFTWSEALLWPFTVLTLARNTFSDQ